LSWLLLLLLLLLLLQTDLKQQEEAVVEREGGQVAAGRCSQLLLRPDHERQQVSRHAHLLK